MADYYEILRKAVDGLERNDAAARRALYERARQTILSRQPLLRQDEIDRHLDGVSEAARRIEAEFADKPAGEPPLTAPPAVHRQPVERDLPPQARAVPARRIGIAVAGVLAAILVAGVGAYYLVARDRAHAPQVSRAEQASPTPAPAKRGSTKREAEVTPDQASYVLRQQRVYYRTTHPVGSIVVARNQRFLYVVQPNNVAIRYAIGVGRECENVAGLFRVTEKIGEPATGAAPPSIADAKARFDAPALYFSAREAVHRTADPRRVGQSSADGCFQAWDRDIADLYNRIQLDDRVIVAN
jgi:lipoprotein-anchoring transpeptidase ErfK/SrfK